MFAVMIEIDNELIYVCGDGKSWSNDDPVKVYETYDEAVEDSQQWNNPEIVSWTVEEVAYFNPDIAHRIN